MGDDSDATGGNGETGGTDLDQPDSTTIENDAANGDDEDHDLGFEPPTEQIASGFEAWRRRTASGTILSAVAFGLAEVFNLQHKKPAIIAEAPGDPYDEDDPVQVDYVPDDAEGTRVRVRPWLFDDESGGV